MAGRQAGHGTAQEVRKRRMFYIPGYDPFPPRRYRELYRKEGRAQGAISGYEVSLKRKGATGWHVRADIEDAKVETECDVLVWSDIVRHSLGASIAATYGAMVRTAWVYISTGALFRLMRLRKGPVLAALYPVAMLIAQAFVAFLVGWLAAKLVFWLTNQGWLAGLVALVLGGICLEGFKRLDRRFFAHYLMLDYSFSARWRGAHPPELDERLRSFIDTIAEALTSDVDEVLVVGHSSGAHLAISVGAELIRTGRVPANGPKLAFLTLGQVVPMVSFLPDAQALRRDLHDLCQSDALTWVDVTAPGDGCAFALCDPVGVSGVAPEQGKRWPLVLSAAFTQTLSPERWKEVRWQFFKLHIQYLCAFDRPGAYDYFRITAGPKTLATRFAGRRASPSRKTDPINRYTDMA